VPVTVLTLDMGLKQARLCGRLDQRWIVGRRQTEELNKVIAAVRDIKASDSAQEADIQKALEQLTKYQMYMNRVLPTAAAVDVSSPRGSEPCAPAASTTYRTKHSASSRFDCPRG